MHSLNAHIERGAFFLFIACLFAIYDTLYILCEIGRWCLCSSWSYPAVATSVIKSPSISSPWACLWVEVPARHQIKPLPHQLYFTVSLSCIYSVSLSVCLRLLQRAWCLAPWQRECLFPRMNPHLMLTHLHNNNPIWSISDAVLDVSNEAIKPDKMLSVPVCQIKKGFGAEDKSRASQIVRNQFFCVNTTYLFHLWDFSFLAACQCDGKRHRLKPDYQ